MIAVRPHAIDLVFLTPVAETLRPTCSGDRHRAPLSGFLISGRVGRKNPVGDPGAAARLNVVAFGRAGCTRLEMLVRSAYLGSKLEPTRI